MHYYNKGYAHWVVPDCNEKTVNPSCGDSIRVGTKGKGAFDAPPMVGFDSAVQRTALRLSFVHYESTELMSSFKKQKQFNASLFFFSTSTFPFRNVCVMCVGYS